MAQPMTTRVMVGYHFDALGSTRLFTDEDLERLEVILKLTRDLGVNLAGVEIILNMREKMAAMQQQIEEFVATLNDELSYRFQQKPAAPPNSLIPVLRTPPSVPKTSGGVLRRKR